MKVVRRYVLDESAHLLYADRGVVGELHPDGADGGCVGVGFSLHGFGDGVFLYHFKGGFGLEGHLAAAMASLRSVMFAPGPCNSCRE